MQIKINLILKDFMIQISEILIVIQIMENIQLGIKLLILKKLIMNKNVWINIK